MNKKSRWDEYYRVISEGVTTIESLLNQLSGLLTGSKHEGGAKVAESMLRQNFSYPSLTSLLRKKLPRKTPVTVLMVASKCVGDML